MGPKLPNADNAIVGHCRTLWTQWQVTLDSITLIAQSRCCPWCFFLIKNWYTGCKGHRCGSEWCLVQQWSATHRISLIQSLAVEKKQSKAEGNSWEIKPGPAWQWVQLGCSYLCWSWKGLKETSIIILLCCNTHLELLKDKLGWVWDFAIERECKARKVWEKRCPKIWIVPNLNKHLNDPLEKDFRNLLKWEHWNEW